MKLRRALVYAPRLPEFDREGGSRRVMHLVELLQELGWAVTYLAEDATDGEKYARHLRQRGVMTYAGPSSRAVGDEYLVNPDRLIASGHFDLAILCFWDRAEALLPVLRSLSPGTRVIVDSIDLHLLRNARTLFQRPAEAMMSRREGLGSDYAQQMIRELNTYAAADAVLAVSQKEAEMINDLTSDPVLAHTVPLIEDMEPESRPFDERSGLVFVGNFRHLPNLEAVEILDREILPLLDPALLARHPLRIVGNGLREVAEDLDLQSPFVQLVGWVPSLVPYLASARVAVVPLRSGAGTKTKLIQALTVGTPTVSTTIGAEGLELRPDIDLLVADEPAAMAAAITRLLTDAKLWRQLAASGKGRIGEMHSRLAVRARFVSTLDAIFARQPKPRGPHLTADDYQSDLVASQARERQGRLLA